MITITTSELHLLNICTSLQTKHGPSMTDDGTDLQVAAAKMHQNLGVSERHTEAVACDSRATVEFTELWS